MRPISNCVVCGGRKTVGNHSGCSRLAMKIRNKFFSENPNVSNDELTYMVQTHFDERRERV